jgi:hypothetical protein
MGGESESRVVVEELCCADKEDDGLCLDAGKRVRRNDRVKVELNRQVPGRYQ